MNSLPLNSITADQIDSFVQQPSHALLLVGADGIGKGHMAKLISAQILNISADKVSLYPYLKIISPEEGGSIGIDEVRQIEKFLRLKVPSKSKYNRVIVIHSAQNLTLEAQNAMLKTLEEPPQGVLIVLCVTHAQSLLPTIISRTQKLQIKKPSKQVLVDYFLGKGYQQKEIDLCYLLSGGMPELMENLLNTSEHPLRQATTLARQLLSQNKFDRLISVEALAKDTSLAKDTLFIIQQMSRVSIKKADRQTASRWEAIYRASYKASKALDRSAQSKLVLTDLCLAF